MESNDKRGRRVLGLIVVAGLVLAVWFCGTHYFVITDTTTTTLKKERFSLLPLVIDLRDWGLRDLAEHPDLVLLFLRQGKGHPLPGGGVAKALLERGEVGVQRLRELVDSGVQSFQELDERYDVSGRLKAGADRLREGARRLDEEYQIRERLEETLVRLRVLQEDYRQGRLSARAG